MMKKKGGLVSFCIRLEEKILVCLLLLNDPQRLWLFNKANSHVLMCCVSVRAFNKKNKTSKCNSARPSWGKLKWPLN